jgi:hypothetical protein
MKSRLGTYALLWPVFIGYWLGLWSAIARDAWPGPLNNQFCLFVLMPLSLRRRVLVLFRCPWNACALASSSLVTHRGALLQSADCKGLLRGDKSLELKSAKVLYPMLHELGECGGTNTRDSFLRCRFQKAGGKVHGRADGRKVQSRQPANIAIVNLPNMISCAEPDS